MANHAYAIIDVEEFATPDQSKQQFVILRNPHGTNIPSFIRKNATFETMKISPTQASGFHKQGVFKLPIETLFSHLPKIESVHKAPMINLH